MLVLGRVAQFHLQIVLLVLRRGQQYELLCSSKSPSYTIKDPLVEHYTAYSTNLFEKSDIWDIGIEICSRADSAMVSQDEILLLCLTRHPGDAIVHCVLVQA
jgi:hypothetical protein